MPEGQGLSVGWNDVKDSIKAILGFAVAIIIGLLLLGLFGGVTLQVLSQTSNSLSGNASEIAGSVYNETSSSISQLSNSLGLIAGIGGVILVLGVLLSIPAIRDLLKGVTE